MYAMHTLCLIKTPILDMACKLGPALCSLDQAKKLSPGHWASCNPMWMPIIAAGGRNLVLQRSNIMNGRMRLCAENRALLPENTKPLLAQTLVFYAVGHIMTCAQMMRSLKNTGWSDATNSQGSAVRCCPQTAGIKKKLHPTHLSVLLPMFEAMEFSGTTTFSLLGG